MPVKIKKFNIFIISTLLIYAQIFISANAKDKNSNIDTDDIILDLNISEILKEQDIHAIYEDTRVTGINLNTKEKYVNDYYADGTVKSKRKNKNWRGIWYTDSKGQHCIRWNHKNKADCELIGLDDDGNWVKFKSDEITKEIESFKDIPK